MEGARRADRIQLVQPAPRRGHHERGAGRAEPHPAQARRLSTPERSGGRTARGRPDQADAVHHRMDSQCRHTAPRAGWPQQERGQPALKNALRVGRQGEIRDRTTEGQHYRIAGLNLLTAIIVYWNTLHLSHAVEARRREGLNTPDHLLAHIRVTGEYLWPKDIAVQGVISPGVMRAG